MAVLQWGNAVGGAMLLPEGVERVRVEWVEEGVVIVGVGEDLLG